MASGPEKCRHAKMMQNKNKQLSQYQNRNHGKQISNTICNGSL